MPTKKTSTPPNNSTIPYGKQQISETDIQAVVDVLKSDYLTQGPLVNQFEQEIANFCESQYAVVFSSGTAALHAACFAADLRANDVGVTSPISFLASANCILYQQAKVHFCDIDPQSAQINVATIQQNAPPQTKVVIPVDFAGYPNDLEPLYAWAQKKNITLIRDAAHAFGASYRHQERNIKVGACLHADMCCFSFHPVKSITSGEGGAITTNNKNLYQRLLRFRHHGINRHREELTNQELASQPWYHEMQELGYNYRLSDIHSALGLAQLASLNEKINKRQELVKYYHHHLKDHVGFLTQDDKNHSSAHHILPILVSPNKRNQLMQALAQQGIKTQLHYIPIYRQPYYQKHFHFTPQDYPHAENYFASALTIPLYPQLSPTQQDLIIKTIIENK